MAWQLIYTSAPRLLDAGRSGFGTVARHRDIPPLVVQTVERFSQFARLPGLDANRIVYSHRVIVLSGSRYQVLSMIRSAGSDYTGRTNHIAHHVIFTEQEAAECAAADVSPADVAAGFPWLRSWDDPPRELDTEELVQADALGPVEIFHSAWAEITGNPEHALLLVTNAASIACRLVSPPGIDFRYLFVESLRWQIASSWDVTFITAEEPNDDPADFRWIVCAPDSRSALSMGGASRPLLDLTRPETLPLPEIPPAPAEPSHTPFDLPPPSLRLPGQYPGQGQNPGRAPVGKHQAAGRFQAPSPTIPQGRPVSSTQPRPNHAKPPAGLLQKLTWACAVLAVLTLLGYGGWLMWSPHQTASHADEAMPVQKEIEVPQGASTYPISPLDEPKRPIKMGVETESHSESIAQSPQILFEDQAGSNGKSKAPAVVNPQEEDLPSKIGSSNANPTETKSNRPSSNSGISEAVPTIEGKIYFIEKIADLKIPVASDDKLEIAVTTQNGELPLDEKIERFYPKGGNVGECFFKKENQMLVANPTLIKDTNFLSTKKITINRITNSTRYASSVFILDKIVNRESLLSKQYDLNIDGKGCLTGSMWGMISIAPTIQTSFEIETPKEVLDTIHYYIDNVPTSLQGSVEKSLIDMTNLNHSLDEAASRKKADLQSRQTTYQTCKTASAQSKQFYDDSNKKLDELKKPKKPDMSKVSEQEKEVEKNREDKDKKDKELAEENAKLISINSDLDKIRSLRINVFIGSAPNMRPKYTSPLYLKFKSDTGTKTVRLCDITITPQ